MTSDRTMPRHRECLPQAFPQSWRTMHLSLARVARSVRVSVSALTPRLRPRDILHRERGRGDASAQDETDLSTKEREWRDMCREEGWWSPKTPRQGHDVPPQNANASASASHSQDTAPSYRSLSAKPGLDQQGGTYRSLSKTTDGVARRATRLGSESIAAEFSNISIV